MTVSGQRASGNSHIAVKIFILRLSEFFQSKSETGDWPNFYLLQTCKNVSDVYFVSQVWRISPLNYNHFCCFVFSLELEVKMKHSAFSMPSNIIPTEIFNRHGGTHLLCHIYCDNVSNNKPKPFGWKWVRWSVGGSCYVGCMSMRYLWADCSWSRVKSSHLDLTFAQNYLQPKLEIFQTVPHTSQAWYLNETSYVGKKGIDLKIWPACSSLCFI